jgi:hypothetical protein
MKSYITKEFSEANSPLVSQDWKDQSEKDRINSIIKILNSEDKYKDFEIINADDDGQVTLKIEKIIPASERGIFLLNLEEKLKDSIDRAITIWLEPVGDKSKLRNLRGINFKTVE